MASKGSRSKLDHDSRARKQKALEAPKEPSRPKTHWDYVLEEMLWLSKDFEAERKWKVGQAKKVALRANKSILDQATRGERKVKEEEQRLRKVALHISKDVKKFWLKIEKLVLYKHQLEMEERKKKALDRQLDFLLGQTERYSTMLAENLVDNPHFKKENIETEIEQECQLNEVGNADSTPVSQQDESDTDAEQHLSQDLSEDDEQTLEEDEALITEDERKEELEALHNEADLPLEELLKSYKKDIASRVSSPGSNGDVCFMRSNGTDHGDDKWNQVNGFNNDKLADHSGLDAPSEEKNSSGRIHRNNYKSPVSKLEYIVENGNDSHMEAQMLNKTLKPQYNSTDFNQDKEYMPSASANETDDETTLSEEERLAKDEAADQMDEIEMLQRESDMSLEELLAKYRKAETELENSDEAEKLNIIEEEIIENHQNPDRTESEHIIADAAAAASSAQPTGNTFLTTKVRTKFPFLLKYPLREYQHIGLDWLVTMYEKRLNGILADEMGLGKTIMTISLLAHLACEKGIWGPHLIVVPTSVMLNWETEFLKWCPAFKILTYFGSAKERKHKRQGWMKLNSFHVCITTYRLVIQDSKVFKRKKWKYLILDEAHLIKNWKSQRWQTLLNFNSKRRILLTGTPLQNDLMELWSLMHFLMPHIFQSHQEFKDWFSNPITGMVEGQEKVNKVVVDRLHNVLRPFILRRLKRDVEKQLPQKFEHVIYCRLSRRQRNLYEDFIASSETQATLASANYFGMISVIMQLRKVCNHPDLFEGRPIISSFDMPGIEMQLSSYVCTIFSRGFFSEVDLKGLNLLFTHHEFSMTSWEIEEVSSIASSPPLISKSEQEVLAVTSSRAGKYGGKVRYLASSIFEEVQKTLWEERVKCYKERQASIAWWNSIKCQKRPVYGTNLRELVTVRHPVYDIHEQKENPSCFLNCSPMLCEIIRSPIEHLEMVLDLILCFMFAIPAARAPSPSFWCSKGRPMIFLQQQFSEEFTKTFSPLLMPIRPAIVRRQVYFPDRRLIQFDCGKLQELAILLRRLKSEGHRALIFTQMTKMLDILEAFINLYGYTYMRLDGSTQPEERQTLMQRFNTNPKIFLFILSTRSGGVGINLVGADTVIFYDSDWNPAMDQQAQDRCHRIGQTREVHIYRLISQSTIEENILKKANQKRVLDDLVIQSGSYNTEFFKKLDPLELFSGQRTLGAGDLQRGRSKDAESLPSEIGENLSNADMEAAIRHAEDEADYMALKRVEQEEAVENQEFSEEVIARLEDDDLVNEYDVKNEEKTTEDQGCWSEDFVNSVSAAPWKEGPDDAERAMVLAEADEEIDMLADVKQMAAAAAAAGQASSSFETQLKPVDRYAMRFLDLWDPVVNKSAIEFQVEVQEEEWELERIEKLKEDLEAEIDEDQEPFLYERWDADFATAAYRQHVEALAQRQLMEELEHEEEMRKNGDNEDGETARTEGYRERKRKSTKKSKTRFKSLKKGTPSITESDAVVHEELLDDMHVDEKMLFPGSTFYESSQHLPVKNKNKRARPAVEMEKPSKRRLKMRKGDPKDEHFFNSDVLEFEFDENGDLFLGEISNELESRYMNQNTNGSKVSNEVMIIKQEKMRKRGNFLLKDLFPSPDPWSSQEDAMVCAIVHEYGPQWSLVSDALHSMAGGGFYRGRFRHPVHCCERFRELFLKHVSAVDSHNTEKLSTGKAFLKVNKDQISMLLEVTTELPDNELLLQKHFVAIFSSIWKSRRRIERPEAMSYLQKSSLNWISPGRNMLRPLTGNANPFVLRQGSKLIMKALDNVDQEYCEEPSKVQVSTEVEQLDLTLEFLVDPTHDEETYPSIINLTICTPQSSKLAFEPPNSSLHSEYSLKAAESRFRSAVKSFSEGKVHGWASTAFQIVDDGQSQSTSKIQSLGKHKTLSDPAKPLKPKVPRMAESSEAPTTSATGLLSSSSTTPCLYSDELPNLLQQWSLGMEDNYEVSSLDISLEDTIIPDDFDTEFFAGLPDLGSQMDLMDIG